MKDSIINKMGNGGMDKTYSLGNFTYMLKRNLIVAILLVIVGTTVSAAPMARLQELPSHGLFQRLIKIKYSSELYLIKNLKKHAAKMPMNQIIQLVDKDLATNDYDQRPQTEGLLENKLFFL